MGNWVRECERKGVRPVGRRKTTLFHILFFLKLNGVAPFTEHVAVLDSGEIGDEVRVMLDHAAGEPFPHKAPHLSSLVGIDDGAIMSLCGPISLGAELNFPSVRFEEHQTINHTTTNATTIDKNRIDLMPACLLDHARSDGHRVDTAERDAWN